MCSTYSVSLEEEKIGIINELTIEQVLWRRKKHMESQIERL